MNERTKHESSADVSQQNAGDANATRPDSAASSLPKKALSQRLRSYGLTSLLRPMPHKLLGLARTVKQRLPAGLEAPIIAAGLVLVLAGSALALYGVIVTTKATSDRIAESPEELFRRGYIARGLNQAMRRVDTAAEAHGATSVETSQAYISLARMLDAAGDDADATAMLEQSRRIAEILAPSAPEAASRCALDLVAAYHHMGDLQSAEDAALFALDISSSAGSPAIRYQSLAALGAALSADEQPESALTAYQKAIAIAETRIDHPVAEICSLRLNAARAAIQADKLESARHLLNRVQSDLHRVPDSSAKLLALHAMALEARFLGAAARCDLALQRAAAALDGVAPLEASARRLFARKSGNDMLEAIRLCAGGSPSAGPALQLMERTAVFMDTVLPPGSRMRLLTLERLAGLSNRFGRPEQSLALNAQLLTAEGDRDAGFDSLMDRDARLMALLSRLAVAESPPQEIATLAFGAWLARRVLYPPTGMPVLNASTETADRALLQEFHRLITAIAGAAPAAHAETMVEPAAFAPEARERLAQLSQSIADRHTSLKPALLWALGENDGYAGAVDALAAALPDNGGLLFFARTRPPQQNASKPDEAPHVLAFLLVRDADTKRKRGRVHVIDYGPVDAVERTIAAWRATQKADDDSGALAQGLAEVELYSLLWAPVRRAAPGLKTLWIGPGDPPSHRLSRLPFGTLPTPEGAPLAAAMHLRRLDRDALLDTMRNSPAQPAVVGLLDRTAE